MKTLRKELLHREEVSVLSGKLRHFVLTQSLLFQRMISELLKSADVVLATNTGASPEGPLKSVT